MELCSGSGRKCWSVGPGKTRINSLQTAVSARRLGVNGGEKDQGGLRPPEGLPEASLKPPSGHLVASR